MPSYASGLIITPALVQRQVSIDLHFQPSVGILARKVDKLGMDIRSFKEPLREAVKEVVIPSIRRNFDAGGRPKWELLVHSTVLRKGGDERPLIRTGKLRREMGYLKIWTIDREKAMITDLPNSIWYGKVHQAGATFSTRAPAAKQVTVSGPGYTYRGSKKDADEGGGEIPARPFVVLQSSDMRKIDGVFNRWLDMRIRLAGLK